MSPIQPPNADPARSDLLVSWICAQLVQSAPEGWRRIDFTAMLTTSARDIRYTVILDDGRSPAAELPEDINFALDDLRMEMYDLDKGTWFSLRFVIDPPDEYFAVFNFNLDPGWDPPLPPEAYQEDLDEFPRSEEHIPAWLQENLAAVQ